MLRSPKIDNSLIGVAGVYYVATELSLRALIALPTIRNTAGVDMLVSNVSGTWHANLQVKASQNKVSFWPVGKRYKEWQGENNWYAFARYLRDEKRFEVFLAHSSMVAVQTEASINRGRELGHAEFTPCWYLPKDTAEVERLRHQWAKFGAQ